MTGRPRTFCWVSRNGAAFPQILFDDPRVGCAELPIISKTERQIHPDDGRPLDVLAADYPAPATETT